jgi:hypothetical protein
MAERWFFEPQWLLNADVDDNLIDGADFSLTSACPLNGLLSARSALLPSVGQIVVGGNNV